MLVSWTIKKRWKNLEIIITHNVATIYYAIIQIYTSKVLCLNRSNWVFSKYRQSEISSMALCLKAETQIFRKKAYRVYTVDEIMNSQNMKEVAWGVFIKLNTKFSTVQLTHRYLIFVVIWTSQKFRLVYDQIHE